MEATNIMAKKANRAPTQAPKPAAPLSPQATTLADAMANAEAKAEALRNGAEASAPTPEPDPTPRGNQPVGATATQSPQERLAAAMAARNSVTRPAHGQPRAPAPMPADPPRRQAVSAKSATKAPTEGKVKTNAAIIADAEAILKEAGTAMHYAALAGELLKRGHLRSANHADYAAYGVCKQYAEANPDGALLFLKRGMFAHRDSEVTPEQLLAATPTRSGGERSPSASSPGSGLRAQLDATLARLDGLEAQLAELRALMPGAPAQAKADAIQAAVAQDEAEANNDEPEGDEVKGDSDDE